MVLFSRWAELVAKDSEMKPCETFVESKEKPLEMSEKCKDSRFEGHGTWVIFFCLG